MDRWHGVMAYTHQDDAVSSGTARGNLALGITTEFIDE